MTEAISMQLGGFLSIYLLLLVIAGIFTYCKIPQTKFLLLGTLQMTVQLIIAGYVLLYIFQNPSPIFVLTYLSLMVGFAVTRTLRKNPWLNRKFKWITALSVIGTCISITSFMLLVVIRKDILTPQYVIPISGMLVSATMNGATLALKSFKENLDSHKQQIEVLLNIGTPPAKILHPFVIQSLETVFFTDHELHGGHGDYRPSRYDDRSVFWPVPCRMKPCCTKLPSWLPTVPPCAYRRFAYFTSGLALCGMTGISYN